MSATPKWRIGATMCNACGLRGRKPSMEPELAAASHAPVASDHSGRSRSHRHIRRPARFRTHA
eukprot:7379523-Prymnesium_polylepis.1